jgi:hypothetical protein
MSVYIQFAKNCFGDVTMLVKVKRFLWLGIKPGTSILFYLFSLRLPLSQSGYRKLRSLDFNILPRFLLSIELNILTFKEIEL